MRLARTSSSLPSPGNSRPNLEELPSFGTACGRNTEDSSEIIRDVFDPMTHFPLLGG